MRFNKVYHQSETPDGATIETQCSPGIAAISPTRYRFLQRSRGRSNARCHLWSRVRFLFTQFPQERHFIVPITAKIFGETFPIDDRYYEILLLLQHDLFLAAFCQLKCRRLELSSLMWTLYFRMRMRKFRMRMRTFLGKLAAKLYLTKNNSMALSRRANYTDRATATCWPNLVSNFSG
jgi:hypothetical protein